MQFGPNGQMIYERTYSREKADGTKETWPETVARVVDGNLSLVDERYHEPNERQKLIDLIGDMKAIPAGRHLWTSGVPGRQFNRNCHRAGYGPTLADHFTFTFLELMKGGGVGANYSSEYLADYVVQAPQFVEFYLPETHADYQRLYEADVPINCKAPELPHVFVVKDSREGWAEALRFLCYSAEYGEEDIICFDLSLVRPFGAPLQTFGGTASGPVPLAVMLFEAAYVLRGAVGRPLTPLETMQIDHQIASCVVAGNVRRSARMSILHWNDPHIHEFLACKADFNDHWSTNISVEVDADFFAAYANRLPVATKVFEAVVQGMVKNGEPGFFNSYAASQGETGDVRATNPCGEIALEEWESCNLGHVNLAAFPSCGDPAAFEAFRLMTRFLIRATFAELEDERQAAVEAFNRRIGVGFFGFQEWAAYRGVRYSEIPFSGLLEEELKAYKRAVNAEARAYSAQLNIPCPVKTTTVAPTGTIAKLPGVSEGIHPIYARYFERRVRFSEADPMLEQLRADGVELETDMYAANSVVAVFPSEDPALSRPGLNPALIQQADELAPHQLIAVLSFVQRVYANNAVSFTANIPAGMPAEALYGTIANYLPGLKGVTVMADESRPQAPYTRVTEDDYRAAVYHEVGQSELDCATGACPIR